ncbi:hypothetical protein GH714_019299 [Hevea brasiliensis]|uniref:RWD domain-containing protein n=1 Tax=Hevea brasiliensis TaxID=3981 RepID=A0A6A6MBC6_HEVBR|nr:hypothetical protein GH714_019299 [Hevea brasiliensis]
MAEEEEVLIEVEAVQAVYGDDCVVLDSFPPHLHVHIKPRTADISSQQFVEAVIGIRAGSQSSDRTEIEDVKLLQCDSEKIRKQKFEAILKLQQENSGIIEPKRDLVVLPGMYLPRPVTLPTQALNKETTEEQQRDSTASMETNSGGSSNRPSSGKHRNFGRRKQRIQNSRKQVRQWVRKDDGPAN